MKFTLVPRSAVVLAVLFTALTALQASAQVVTLVGAPDTVGDADEYFTDMGRPKNFNSPCDLGRDGWYYTPKTTAGGVFTGVNPAKVGPLFSPLPIPTLGTDPIYREACGSSAIEKPVEAAKYRYISYRLSTSQSGFYAVLWTINPVQYALHGYDGNNLYCTPGNCFQAAANEWILEHDDLPTRQNQTPWSGNVYGLTIWPSAFLPTGSTTRIDWVRLIDPTTSPEYPLSWTTAGGGHPSNFVNVRVDTNNSGFDGSLVAARLTENDAYDVQTGILAPGTYYFYTELLRYSGATVTLLDRSDYVGPLVVNGKPSLEFTAPSRTSGPEYSRDERGNVWDMNDASDVANLVGTNGVETPASFRGFHNYSFQNGYFMATSDHDPVGFTVDTQVHMATASNKPVNPNFYRYFCYNFQVSAAHIPRDGDIPLLNDAGWVTRMMWVKNGVTDHLGQTYPIEYDELSTTYPDYNHGFITHCLDLWDETLRETGPGWRESRQISTIRFDPMEARPTTQFAINWAGLFAENQSNSSDAYTIRWRVSDPEAANMTIQLFRDNDRSGFNGTPIANLPNQSSGLGQYIWDAIAVPRGTYYIYAVVTDGTNTGRFYSDVPVHITSTPGIVGAPTAAMCDYNGDGKSDFAFVRGNKTKTITKEVCTRKPGAKRKKCKRVRTRVPYGAANWNIRFTGTNTTTTPTHGDLRYDVFYPFDGDGDGVSDEFFAGANRTSSNAVRQRWLSSFNPVARGAEWGRGRDIPVFGDFNGDRMTDYTMFRPSSGQWFSLFSGTGTLQLQWGASGDVPFAGDFDGDGKSDAGYFHPEDATWHIALSSSNFNTASPFERQWGGSGDMPMPADYDGDRRTDIAVFRPASGNWFICYSSDSYNCAQGDNIAWGNPGDVPVMGDFDGDGKADPAVWRPNTGQWFVRQSSNGQMLSQTYGRSTDRLVCGSPRYLQGFVTP